MNSSPPEGRLVLKPSRRDWVAVVLIALAGAALGLAINAASPRGFNFKVAAASSDPEPGP